MIQDILNVKEKLKELSLEEQKKLITEYRSFLIKSPQDFNNLYKELENIPADPRKKLYSFYKLKNITTQCVSDELKIKGMRLVLPNLIALLPYLKQASCPQ